MEYNAALLTDDALDSLCPEKALIKMDLLSMFDKNFCLLKKQMKFEEQIDKANNEQKSSTKE